MGLFDWLTGKKNQPLEIRWPFEVIRVPGTKAVQTCMKLRQKGQGTFTPVIMGSDEKSYMLADGLEIAEESPGQLIALSNDITAEEFFENRKNEDSELYGQVEIGEWPEELPSPQGITAHTNILSGRPLKEVLIANVPTARSFEVPAYFKYGSVNDCPAAEEHVAVLKYWKEKYGADIISLAGDVIECTVDHPPANKEDALRLAHEHFVYCSDIVFQGTGTLSCLASVLMNSNYWYFWWD